MTTQVTRELTCVGPPAHTWTYSRPKGSRGTWPQRCPTHKAQHLTALRVSKNTREQRKRREPRTVVVDVDKVDTDARDMREQLNKALGLPTGTTATVFTEQAQPTITTTGIQTAEHTCPQLPEDLQRIDRLADQVLPDKRTFRQAAQAISQTHSERAYEKMAAVCVAAARLLRGPQGQNRTGVHRE